jgi:ribosomal peptide maturation radical SAM protein 1
VTKIDGVHQSAVFEWAERMRVALVAMPWSVHTRPSAALGALSAFLAREAPQHAVRVASEYVGLAEAVGFELYEQIAEYCYEAGEPFYMALLYPERAEAVRAHFRSWATSRSIALRADEAFDHLASHVRSHLDDVAARTVADVLGLTTCFGQMFANLALAKRVKELRPSTTVVLGGSTVSAAVGPSILRLYPQVDFVVQGEGEQPFAALLGALASQSESVPQIRGVVARGDDRPADLWEVARLDDLPVPDYDEYADQAESRGIHWALPMEGSRGCWWDRTKRHGNPRATCYFCNLNVQWGGYREKSVPRVISEVDQLTDRYANTTVYFLDNIIRARGIDGLATGLTSLEKDLEIFYEMRASVSPYEILLLWEAGLTSAQFGLEALSTSLLQRIGKGTTLLQNLQVMKTCAELGISHGANLILDFPGSTQAEVDETVRCIEDYAASFEPCSLTSFHLGIDSTVDLLPERFGIATVQSARPAQVGLPDDVRERLVPFERAYRCANAQVSWEPVRRACDAWRAQRRAVRGPLVQYQDGRRHVRIIDRRANYEVITLSGIGREAFLACLQIQSRERLRERFERDSRVEVGGRRR